MWWDGRGYSSGSWLPEEQKANMWPGRGNSGGSWLPAFPRSPGSIQYGGSFNLSFVYITGFPPVKSGWGELLQVDGRTRMFMETPTGLQFWVTLISHDETKRKSINVNQTCHSMNVGSLDISTCPFKNIKTSAQDPFNFDADPDPGSALEKLTQILNVVISLKFTELF